MKLIDKNKLFNSYIQYIILSKSFKSNKYVLSSLILSLKLFANII